MALPDHRGPVEFVYAPHPDGHPDPGEIVWTWVPFEDDPAQGKDRPVLVIGRSGRYLLGLMLTSKDHDRDAAAQARQGRHWLDVGTGAWDAQRRPSEVRLDRVLTIDPATVRREGATFDRARFDEVARAVQSLRGAAVPSGRPAGSGAASAGAGAAPAGAARRGVLARLFARSQRRL